MPRKYLKGQNTGMAGTLVVVAVALIIGVFVYATISPQLTNQAILNDTIGTFSKTSGVTRCLNNPPIAPGTTPLVENCSTTGYTTCNTPNTGNWTTDIGRNCIVSLTSELDYVRVNFTSGILPAGGQAASTNISNNTFTAFTLAAVVLIVIAAAAIIRNLGLFG